MMEASRQLADVALRAQALSVQARHDPDKKTRVAMVAEARDASAALRRISDELELIEPGPLDG